MRVNFAKSGSDALVINWRLPQWFPELSSETLEMLKKFHDELLKFNKTIPLINVKNISTGDLIYFADSVLATKLIFIENKGEDVFDFGSGSGFPGLVFGVLNRKTKVYLVESDSKKCEFLKHIIVLLKLDNVSVINKSVDLLPEASVRFALVREFNTITKTLLSSRKIFAVGGSIYHIKGDEWANEIASIPSQLCSFWTPELLNSYKLPGTENKRAIVKTKKIQV